jgi:hypothetical protein
VVVDDGLGLFERGLAGQDAVAQAPGHGQQAEGLRVRLQVGGRVAGGLGRTQPLTAELFVSSSRPHTDFFAACATWTRRAGR